MKKKYLLVIDSSVAVKWLNQKNEQYIKQADKILFDVQNNKITLIMPELSKYEIGNAILNKELNISETATLFDTFYSLPINFVNQDIESAQDSLKIAKGNKITFYDASFIALANKIQACLVTDNPKHQMVKKGKTPKIVLLKNYR